MCKKTCIILIGGPCSGKSTIGKMVASKVGAKYISSGDIAREMGKINSTVGKDLSDGKMAPEEWMRNEIYNAINNTNEEIIILDGFPRFYEQAEWLYDKFSDMFNIRYVLLYVPLTTIIERSMHRNREDDKSIEQRIHYYYDITYKELYSYISIVIDADEYTAKECSEILTNFIIKEVINSVKNC